MLVNYVTIADYQQPDEAQRARASLEHEGIPTLIENAHAESKILRLFDTGFRHLQLKVPSELADKARQVLRTVRDAPGDAGL